MNIFKTLKKQMGILLPEEKIISNSRKTVSNVSSVSYTLNNYNRTNYNYSHNASSKKYGTQYYAYGTYAKNGKLYTMEGKEIKNKEAYYSECRRNKTATTKTTYTSKGITYEFQTDKKPYNYYFNNKYSKYKKKS